jgi:diguanylate cyclase (GGDEF)-like protein
MEWITRLQEEHAQVINVAGRQRMLTQKMTKQILLITSNEGSREELLSTVNKFEDNLQSLTQRKGKADFLFSKKEAVKKQQRKVTTLWQEFKKNINVVIRDDGQTKEEAIEYVKNNNIELLNEVDKMVELYEKDSMRNIVLIMEIVIFIIISFIILATWIIIKNIIKASETDELTNVYNRKRFMKEAEQEIARVKRYELKLSLIMFDIDSFKEINDTYGHDTGDEVLIEVTNIVAQMTRKVDIFARWGGDEFMVLLPNTDLESSLKLAKRLRREISGHDFKEVGEVTCSFGVVEFKTDDNLDPFLRRVDSVLYKAKEKGRNQVVAEEKGEK